MPSNIGERKGVATSKLFPESSHVCHERRIPGLFLGRYNIPFGHPSQSVHQTRQDYPPNFIVRGCIYETNSETNRRFGRGARSTVRNALSRMHKHSLIYCQEIYSQFGLAIHQNDHQARRRFVEWAQNEIAVVPDFHKRILFSDEAHFWLNGYVNKQNCRIWSEANPQVYVETPLHPEKLTVWCALWAGGILQKR
ncbi:hypothetical protein TNCV_4551701 [Trichonephila clavipes]|nr:hypothetical protein TNCV_4551701 [Trichonephila clavipes]